MTLSPPPPPPPPAEMLCFRKLPPLDILFRVLALRAGDTGVSMVTAGTDGATPALLLFLKVLPR